MKKRVFVVLCLINILGVILSGCSSDYDINQLHKITNNEDFTYDYVVKDKNNNILISDNGVSREPIINVINGKLLSVSVQTGTGVSTKWTVYCDVDSGKVSDEYYSVLGEFAEKAVFVKYEGGVHSIVVQNVFDKQQYYKEIALEDASDVPDPVVSFEKIDDKVKIVYLKGVNCSETELIIEI